jgi:hypothetical protein
MPLLERMKETAAKKKIREREEMKYTGSRRRK